MSFCRKTSGAPMAENSAIEWTDATVNFWWGCTKVGPGCDHCYAEALDKRYGGSHWGLDVPRRTIKGAAALMYKLNSSTSRRRVFVQSMSDRFDLEVPLEWFAEAWQHIEYCSRLDLQIVTKRVSAVEKRLDAIGRTKWPSHAGLMITVVNQAEADRDVPRLLALTEKLSMPWVGLSIEPMLGEMDLRQWLDRIDWVIVGGESGPRARPMHPDWARSLRDQCAAAAVPFFFKQWGEFREWDHETREITVVTAGTHFANNVLAAAHSPSWITTDGRHITKQDDLPEEGQPPARLIERLGKQRAGRLLDGREHNEFPDTAP
jgi:protein gp37